MQKKSVLLLSLIVVCLLLVGGVTWFLILRNRANEESSRVVGGSPTPPIPGVQGGSASPLVPNPVTSLFESPDNSRLRYFDLNEGLFNEIAFSGGSPSRLSRSALAQTYSVVWSPAGDAAIVEYLDGEGKNRRAYLPFGNRSAIQLDEHIKTVTWSPDGKRILYHYKDEMTGNGYIATANPDGSGAKVQIPVALPRIKVFWPTATTAFLLELPAPGLPNLLLKLDLKNNTLSRILDPRQSLSILPVSGKEMLFVSYIAPEGYSEIERGGAEVEKGEIKNTLVNELIDFSGETLRNLPFSTLPAKCAWTNLGDALFCGVPQTAIERIESVLFDFVAGAISTSDLILRYDVAKDTTSTLTPQTNVNLVNPVVSVLKKSIGFINRLDGKLYVVEF
ncbi:MAG: hypothetical protein HYS57_00295 [Parcubacteria group bacterium]|nr:hypothetical protein [Parcubacteria group bacterium]